MKINKKQVGISNVSMGNKQCKEVGINNVIMANKQQKVGRD